MQVPPGGRQKSQHARSPRNGEVLLMRAAADVDLGLKHDHVGTVTDLELSVPLPPGTAATATGFTAPGEPDLPLQRGGAQ